MTNNRLATAERLGSMQ